MGPSYRLAIDLGTCHTVAVVHRGDEAPRALLFDGSPVMASGIYADESGRLSVGRDAERLSQVSPARFEPYPKRSIDEGSVLLGETEVTVVEMLAALLRRVADESLQAGVNPVGSTVLTCPADWGGQRRGVLLEAARAANLGPVVLVDEPIAAATYCLRVLGQQVAPLQSLAVFDFGGGTLDVSVVRREFDGLRVLGVGGLDDLGGVDIDAALVGHLGQLISFRHPEIWQRIANPDGPAAHRDRRALWTEVRAAKEMLSRAASAPIHVPGTEEALHLTREELDRVAGPLIDRAVDETRRVLERAGVDVRQIAGIFLVGGSSRIPLVASRLHARFGVAPVVPEQPELPVAYGGMLAVATAPQQQFDAQAVPQPRPVSGTPVSPGHSPAFPPSTSFPVSAGFPVSSAPTSPGAYGSPASVSSPPGFHPTPPSGYPPAPGAAGPSAPAGFPGQRPPQPPQQFPQQRQQQPPGTPPGYPPLSFTPAPPSVPVPVRPRRRSGPWISLIIVLALLGGCLWGGTKVFSWIGGEFQSIKDGFPGSAPTDDNGNLTNPQVQGLKAGTPITLPSDGAIGAVAGNGAVYTAALSSGAVDVTAYEVTGAQKWLLKLQMEPKKLHLTVVGNLLLVDGEDDTKRGDQKDTRGVIDVATGTTKWTAPHDDRLDVAYVGTDAIIEVRAFGSSSLERVNLLDGKTRWSHPGEKDAHYNFTERAVQPAQRWPSAGGAADARPMSYDLTFNNTLKIQSSLAVDTGAAVQLLGDTKAATIDLNNGAVRSSGQYASAGPDSGWIAYNDLAIFPQESKNVLTAYRMSDWGKAWEYKATAGTELTAVRPCGEKLVCAKAKLSNSKDAMVAIDTATGAAKWTKNAPADKTTGMTDEALWTVAGGKLVAGFGPFDSIDDAAVLDPNNGNDQYRIGANDLQIHDVEAAYGGKVAVLGFRNAATAVQIGIVNVADNKVLGTADVSAQNNLQIISMTDNAVAVLDEKARIVQRYSIPGPA